MNFWCGYESDGPEKCTTGGRNNRQSPQENPLLKSYKQQRIEAEYNGEHIKDILLAELKARKGMPRMIPTLAVALKISAPTLRAWCEDMEIDIGDYK